MSTNTAPYQTQPPSASWSRAMPLKVGIGMMDCHHPMFGVWRCTVTVDDEGGGPFLIVEFFNDQHGNEDSPHCGYFNTHADIDQFAAQLHDILAIAEKFNA